MDIVAVVVIFAALIVGLAAGWWFGNRGAAELRDERDAREDDFKAAIGDLARAQERADEIPGLRTAAIELRDERDTARIEISSIRADVRAANALIERLQANEEQMSSRFAEIAGRTLTEAQDNFLKRADARFNQAGETSEAKLKALLQPVEATLRRYEENVVKVEGERKEAYGNLSGLMDAMRIGQDSVRSEARQAGQRATLGPQGARPLGRAATAQCARDVRAGPNTPISAWKSALRAREAGYAPTRSSRCPAGGRW